MQKQMLIQILEQSSNSWIWVFLNMLLPEPLVLIGMLTGFAIAVTFLKHICKNRVPLSLQIIIVIIIIIIFFFFLKC